MTYCQRLKPHRPLLRQTDTCALRNSRAGIIQVTNRIPCALLTVPFSARCFRMRITSWVFLEKFPAGQMPTGSAGCSFSDTAWPPGRPRALKAQRSRLGSQAPRALSPRTGRGSRGRRPRRGCRAAAPSWACSCRGSGKTRSASSRWSCCASPCWCWSSSSSASLPEGPYPHSEGRTPLSCIC